MQDDQEFPIRTEKVASYFFWLYFLVIAAATCGLGLVLLPFYAVLGGSWLSGAQAKALRYGLQGSSLIVHGGVFFLARKTVPLDRVTDFVLVQGPLMRRKGIWAIKVQTAGMGHGMPEAVLYGLEDPERVRDLLVEARDRAVSAPKER